MKLLKVLYKNFNVIFLSASLREVEPLLRIKRLIYEFVSKTFKGG